MATQKPIVLVSGQLRQLATGDQLELAALGSGTPLTGKVLSGTGAWIYPPATISAKTAAYTVVATDANTIINCTSGTFTVSLTAAATLGAGFQCWVWNTSATSTDAVTIDPSGTETIDGVTTLLLRMGEGVQIICTGTSWQTGGKKAMRGYAENFLPTAVRPRATGQDAAAVGNSYANGSSSFAVQIQDSTTTYGAGSNNSVAMLQTARTSGVGGSVAMGQSAIATVGGAFSLGAGTQATAGSAFALGNYSLANAYGKLAYASGSPGVAGLTQRATMVLRTQTSDATPSVMTSNGAVVSSTNIEVLQDSTAFAFTGTVVAIQQSPGTQSAAWKVEGLIRRGVGVLNTVLVTSSVTAISNAPAWGLAISADTTNGALSFTFTGAAATKIRAVADINTVEVTY